MGRRKKRVRQEGLWTPTAALPVGASHPFYQRLNQILDEKKFDEYVETICEDFYAGEVGRPVTCRGDLRFGSGGLLRGIDWTDIAWRPIVCRSGMILCRIALDESVPDKTDYLATDGD